MQTKQKTLHRCTFEGCDSVFNRPYRLAQHLLVHNNIKGFPCPETNCGKAYTNKSHLDRHINNIHKVTESDMLFSCPTCLKKYANRQNLKRHVNITHKVKISFSCDICKLNFLKKHQLTAHMYQHTGIMSFSCELCHKEFVSLKEKKKHARNHKIYRCSECNATFSLWSKYQKHIRLDHMGRAFVCNYCDRHFKLRSHMVRHIKTHSKIKTTTFPCPYDNCERVYSRNSNLKQHILMKHERIRHECKMCGAELSTKAKLVLHLKLHSDPNIKTKPPKTKLTGRKERKDAGSMKISTAIKLAGFKEALEPEIIDVIV
ncbi:gastrula zinc finger protein XlCGF8.2DB-like [Cydia pomonella]|uniref:gastrula zinc finger protein XlCGF8.2DB-like n=1 Tax=Cydia pomonella TaxID=82600 RepID=UPI002ADE0F57|nr:gastrula zinc finger protein XlCGF8.2DB-like [Cydia pomonella]